MDNPYLKMIEAIRKIGKGTSEPFFYIGRVVEELPEVVIEFAGIHSKLSDFMHTDMISALRKGDEVIILASQAEQRFILLCRVVRA